MDVLHGFRLPPLSKSKMVSIKGAGKVTGYMWAYEPSAAGEALCLITHRGACWLLNKNRSQRDRRSSPEDQRVFTLVSL